MTFVSEKSSLIFTILQVSILPSPTSVSPKALYEMITLSVYCIRYIRAVLSRSYILASNQVPDIYLCVGYYVTQGQLTLLA